MTMLMRPLSQAGRDWLSDNLPKGDLRVGSNAFIPGNRITATSHRHPESRGFNCRHQKDNLKHEDSDKLVTKGFLQVCRPNAV